MSGQPEFDLDVLTTTQQRRAMALLLVTLLCPQAGPERVHYMARWVMGEKSTIR